MYKILGTIILAFLIITDTYAGDLTAEVKKTTINFGELFDFTVSYDGDDGYSLKPDFKELQNDFTIYSTSSSVQSSFFNGKSSVNRTWRLKLMPKKSGKVVIPAIKVGNYLTKTIDVMVSDSSTNNTVSSDLLSNNNVLPTSKTDDNTATNFENFAADVKVDIEEPYVQQEVNVVLTIRDPKGLELTSEPLIDVGDDWIVKMVKRPIVDNNGHGLREIKFYYAFFPQKSGELVLPAMRVEGFYTSFNNGSQGDELTLGGLLQMFDIDMGSIFGTRQPVVLHSKPVKMNIKPIAANYGNNWWLPSGAVGLAARWSETHPVYKVGETVTREVLLTAEGVADTQLPELNLVSSPSLKQYPEKPVIDSVIDNGKVTSKALTRIVYIPQKSGKQIIPEITVPWFNVETENIEIAVIPAETIEVQNSGIPATVLQSQPTYTGNAAAQEVKQSMFGNNKFGLVWIILAFLAGVSISWLLLRHKKKSLEENKNELDWQKSMVLSIKSNDFKALRDSLIQGGREIFNGKINNLTDLDNILQNKEFSEQIKNLNNRLYNNADVKVDGKLLLSILKKYKHLRAKKKIIDPLPDLYK